MFNNNLLNIVSLSVTLSKTYLFDQIRFEKYIVIILKMSRLMKNDSLCLRRIKILHMNKTSDYLEYDVALNKGLKLLNDKKMCVIGFYIILSVNTGLRISDILILKHSDISDDKLFLKEKKTKKAREIFLNKVVKNSYQSMLVTLNLKNVNIGENYIFLSQKETVYRTQSINVILKTLFNTKRLQISSHSLRKAFARKVYENMNESENALVLLSGVFNHSNIAITRRYLGIRQDTIDNIYLTLE